MSDIANKVETLMEAMPYLQKYQGKIIVIKYGGNAMINEELKDAVMHDVVLLKLLGMKPVLSRHHACCRDGARRPGEHRARRLYQQARRQGGRSFRRQR